MKKLLLSCILLLPLTVFAQLDKIRPGMTLDEFRKQFPAAVPDVNGMTSWVNGKDSLQGMSGHVTYLIRRDTVFRYQFLSEEVPGPGPEFPKADSAQTTRMMAIARTLVSHYTDLFGSPAEMSTLPLSKTAPNEKLDVFVLNATWKLRGGVVRILVHRAGTDEERNMINATMDRRKPGFHYYTFQVVAEGTGMEIRSEFGTGISSVDFRNTHPALASQVKAHPDRYVMDSETGEWKFWFVDNRLKGFTMNAYDGLAYRSKSNEQAYSELRKIALKLEAEANKLYGEKSPETPDSPKDYPARKPSATYYSEIHYDVRWMPKEGGELRITLREHGGGKSSTPVFHLEVLFQ
jgi:hypothetical protein